MTSGNVLTMCNGFARGYHRLEGHTDQVFPVGWERVGDCPASAAQDRGPPPPSMVITRHPQGVIRPPMPYRCYFGFLLRKRRPQGRLRPTRSPPALPASGTPVVALTREPEVRDFVAVAQSGISGSGELRWGIVIVHCGHDQVGSLQRILALRRLGQLQVPPEDEQKHLEVVVHSPLRLTGDPPRIGGGCNHGYNWAWLGLPVTGQAIFRGSSGRKA